MIKLGKSFQTMIAVAVVICLFPAMALGVGEAPKTVVGRVLIAGGGIPAAGDLTLTVTYQTDTATPPNTANVSYPGDINYDDTTGEFIATLQPPWVPNGTLDIDATANSQNVLVNTNLDDTTGILGYIDFGGGNAVNADLDFEIPAGANSLPVAQNVTIDPTTQTAGGSINLSGDITDDTEVVGVEYLFKLAADGAPSGADTWTDIAGITPGQTVNLVNEPITVPLQAGSWNAYVRGVDSVGPGNPSTPAALTVEAGPADKLGLEASKNIINTDGIDTVTLTVSLLDANDNVVTGQTPDVTIDQLPDATYATLDSATQAINGATGTVDFTLTSTGTEVTPDPPGTDTFTVQATSAGLTASAIETITAQNDVLESLTITPTTATAKVGGDTASFTAEATYQTAGPVDVTDQATWSVTPGTGDGDITQGANPAVFTGTAEGTATLQATFGGETSNTATVTIQPPDALVFNCAGIPAIRLGESYDLSNAVSGGIPPYSYEITAGPTNVGALGGSLFEVVDNTPFAGTYTVQVSDNAPTPQTQTCNITVPLAITPALTSAVEGGAPATITIKGVPDDVTGFNDTLGSGAPVPAEYGVFSVTLNTPGTPTATVEYSPPAKSDTVTQSQEFTARFTAEGGALAGQFVENQNRMTALIDYAARVTDGTDPVEGVVVTALFDTAKTDTTIADGTFTIADIEVGATTFGFSFTKTGYASKTVELTAAEILAGADVVLTEIGVVAGTIEGIVTLGDARPAGFVELSLMADGTPVTVPGGGTLFAFPNPTTGAYTIEVPDAFGSADQYTIMAKKFGYVDNNVTFDGPLNIAGADIGLEPIRALNPSGNQPLPGFLVLTIGASPDFTSQDDAIITGDLTNADFPFAGSSYVTDPITYDTNPIGLTIESDQTIRHWCYVDGQSDAEILNIDNPSASGGSVTTPRGVTVILPPGGLVGQALERVTLYAVDAVPAEAYGTTLAENQIVAGPVMVEVVLIGADRNPVPDSEIDQVIIEMPYDNAAVSADQLLSGFVPIYMVEGPDQGGLYTNTLCTMIAATSGMPAVPPSQILDVNAVAGTVTFWVDSLSAFAIANPEASVLPPTILSVSPATNVSTGGGETITVNGTGFNSITQLLVGGADFPNYTLISDSQLTFPAPAGSAGAIKTVQVRNSAGLSNTASFRYAGSAPPPPPPPPTVFPPVVNFEVIDFEDDDIVEIVAGTELEFNDLSSGVGMYRWQWDFNYDDPDSGEEFESDERNPMFTYEEPGTYTVRLRVTGTGGTGTKIMEDFIVVSPRPAFTVSPDTTGCAPFTVTLTDTSQLEVPEGETVSIEWLVDDQPMGTSSPLELTLDTPGSYEVVLQATVGDGDPISSQAQTITVEDCQVAVDFNFNIAPAPDCRQVQFLVVTDAELAAQVWEFGDGNVSNEPDPVHVYAADGSYQVTLNAVLANLEERTVTQTVTIECEGAPTGQITADFSAEPISGSAPLTVSFTDQSSATNGITSRTWDFDGDGTPDSTNTTAPVFVYNNPGTFTAVLMVQGPDGQDTADIQITVESVTPPEGVNPPMGREPADGAVDVGLNPVLRIDPYNDPDNVYGATQWEIATDPSFEEIFMLWRETRTSGTEEDFMLAIPDFILEAGPGTYYWRVRFVDADGNTSPWAGPYMFSTVAVDPADENASGVPDDREVDDPTMVFPDLDPTNPLILFVRAAMGDGYWAVEGMENVLEMIALKAYTTDAEGVNPPPNTEMPLGVIGYKLVVGDSDAPAYVRVYFDPAAPENAVWFSFVRVEGWQEFSGDTADFGDGMAWIDLKLEDGGLGDIDGIKNGIIIVPLSGYGVVEVVEGDGGSDTCFIESVAGSDSGWSLLPLVGMAVIACFGIVNTARRQRR